MIEQKSRSNTTLDYNRSVEHNSPFKELAKWTIFKEKEGMNTSNNPNNKELVLNLKNIDWSL